jgi:hypothetical protein
VIALVAAIWAGNNGQSAEEDKIEEDQTVETTTGTDETAPENDSQVKEEGDLTQQEQNEATAEEEMVEGTEQN